MTESLKYVLCAVFAIVAGIIGLMFGLKELHSWNNDNTSPGYTISWGKARAWRVILTGITMIIVSISMIIRLIL